MEQQVSQFGICTGAFWFGPVVRPVGCGPAFVFGNGFGVGVCVCVCGGDGGACLGWLGDWKNTSEP